MYDNYLIGIAINTDPDYKVEEHQHPEWEITYHTHGEDILHVNNMEVGLYPKKVVIVPPGMPHSLYSKNGYCNICLLLKNPCRLETSLYHFDDTSNNDIYSLLMQIYNLYVIQCYNWKIITESLIDVLFLFINLLINESEGNSYVATFKNILAANISSKHFQIYEALKDIPLSGVQFRRIFKNETGKTPLEYFDHIKMEYAKRAMRNKQGSKFTIKEIANMVGFSDPYYFSRWFRKISQKSPSQWIQDEVDLYHSIEDTK